LFFGGCVEQIFCLLRGWKWCRRSTGRGERGRIWRRRGTNALLKASLPPGSRSICCPCGLCRPACRLSCRRCSGVGTIIAGQPSVSVSQCLQMFRISKSSRPTGHPCEWRFRRRFVGGDEAGWGVAYAIFFQTDSSQVAQGAQDGRHLGATAHS
jgi:hypothetical protein